MKIQRGFTLVEILVSISILAIIGVLILNVFSGALRGGNKAQIVLAIKQNGQSILESMDKNIRGADGVVCINSQSGNKILVIVKNGIYTRYKFVDPAPAINGQIQQDNPAKAANGSEGNVNDFINRVCNSGDLLGLQSPIATLTDTNTKSGVSIQNGSFTRNEQAGFKDVITVKFDIAQGVGVAEGTSSVIDPVHFETTIQLR